LCTSGFVDDVFSYDGVSGPASNTTLRFNEVRQVAATVGRQTTSVWSSSSECGTRGEVCYLSLLCLLFCRGDR